MSVSDDHVDQKDHARKINRAAAVYIERWAVNVIFLGQDHALLLAREALRNIECQIRDEQNCATGESWAVDELRELYSMLRVSAARLGYTVDCDLLPELQVVYSQDGRFCNILMVFLRP